MGKKSISIILLNGNYKKQLRELISHKTKYFWFYLGRNAEVAYNLERKILRDIDRINISRYLSKSQYKYRDSYIEFIDNFEKNSGKSYWWTSRLSCKNTWISNFFIRFSQLDVCETIINENTTNNILIVVEEGAVFKSLRKNIKNPFNSKINFYSQKRFVSPRVFIRGIIKRAAIIPIEYFRKRKYNKIFSKTLFRIDNNRNNKLILFPTFIDQRSFRHGYYADPFIGKILKERLIEKRKVVFIPIVINASSEQLRLFDEWLRNNDFNVFLLPQSLSLIKATFNIFTHTFKTYKRCRDVLYGGYNVSDLINYERFEEWSGYNLQSFYIKKIGKILSKNIYQKICIYPFENQQWERILLYEFRKNNDVITIGLQNAPCPLLSTRYYVSKNLVEEIPLPDNIIATGEVSYNNLNNNYKSKVSVLKSSSARSFRSFEKLYNKNRDIKNLMAACAIGEYEAIELITILVSYLKDYFIGNLQVNIVPHPLSKVNFGELLKRIEAPKTFKISSIGFDAELIKSDFILYDSSTVGLEGMLNNIQPVYLGHECSVHVNPNEFDKQITRHIYSKEEFLSAISKPILHNESYQSISMRYFGSQSKSDLDRILISILRNSKDEPSTVNSLI